MIRSLAGFEPVFGQSPKAQPSALCGGRLRIEMSKNNRCAEQATPRMRLDAAQRAAAITRSPIAVAALAKSGGLLLTDLIMELASGAGRDGFGLGEKSELADVGGVWVGPGSTGAARTKSLDLGC